MGIENECKYKVKIRRDTEMMKTFVKFSNRVKHPKVTLYMLTIGVLLLILPFTNKGIKMPGVIISLVMGVLLVGMALFRHNISVQMMKSNPEVKENEELTYMFGNTGVKVKREDKIEHMGSYHKIYRVWEDEKNFYVGMNEDDLLILPRVDFCEGDVSTFRDFILDKSRADYRWQPTGFVNICKQKWMQMQMKMMENQAEDEEGSKKK